MLRQAAGPVCPALPASSIPRPGSPSALPAQPRATQPSQGPNRAHPALPAASRPTRVGLRVSPVRGVSAAPRVPLVAANVNLVPTIPRWAERASSAAPPLPVDSWGLRLAQAACKASTPMPRGSSHARSAQLAGSARRNQACVHRAPRVCFQALLAIPCATAAPLERMAPRRAPVHARVVLQASSAQALAPLVANRVQQTLFNRAKA